MTSDDTPAKSEPAKTPASTPSETPSKSESSAPASHSRGEGQKPVSRAYRDNWNLIFGDKPKPTARKAGAKKPSKPKSRAKAAKKAKR
jgi:hypothetical protein